LLFSSVKWDRDKTGRLRSAKSGSNRRKTETAGGQKDVREDKTGRLKSAKSGSNRR
jgi:hypothetical protein